MATHDDVARALLSIQAVFLRPDDPFIWASGIKSPIYCDNRLILSHTETRTLIDEALAELIKLLYPEAEMLMGTATAGIAHAAIAADRLALPMGYVRGSAKDHGRQNQIEGRMEAGTRVVIVEDLVSTAGSVIECAEVLREAGAFVLGAVSIFSYGMPRGQARLADAELNCDSLCAFDDLLNVAVNDGYISLRDRERLLAFRDDPESNW